MTLSGEYVPSAAQWVRDQVEAYERTGGQQANTLRDTGLPVIIVTMRGNKSGKVRKVALMRVVHDGEYALVASKGGAPEHPVWYYNLTANPDEVIIQDGAEPFEAQVREVTRRRTRRMVGARRRRLPALRRVPEQDRPGDPGLRGQPPTPFLTVSLCHRYRRRWRDSRPSQTRRPLVEGSSSRLGSASRPAGH